MNHRERALAALHHETPDRVPVDLGSTRNTGILQLPYEALVGFLGLAADARNAVPEALDAGKASGHGMSKMLGLATPEEAVLQRLGIDFRGVFLGKSDASSETLLPAADNGSLMHRDEFGVVRTCPPGGHYFDVVQSPLDGDITVRDITRYPWPDPADPGITRGLRERALRIRETTDCALILHMSDIFVHTSQYMRGFEPWYMDLALDPGLIGALMDAILEIRLEVLDRALDAVGDLVDVVSTADDVADQRGPAMSLDMYRRIIKPRHARYLRMIRERTDAVLLFHSCGSVVDLLPDFVDMGIQALNPVQVSARGMAPAKLKAAFGDELVFWGGVDTMHTLPFGTPEEVRAEVRRRKRELGPGGYVLTAVHNIQPDVPPANIVAMYEEALAS
ncbi:MAG: uroporphyrinogen decarboxylase family protein [Anaerolineae bacterium]|nr:uroporphyrinogen decarboxylase family protein [Anaerolineae bacterium]